MSATCRGCGGTALEFEYNFNGALLLDATAASDAAGDCWVWLPGGQLPVTRWNCNKDADAVMQKALARHAPKPRTYEQLVDSILKRCEHLTGPQRVIQPNGLRCPTCGSLGIDVREMKHDPDLYAKEGLCYASGFSGFTRWTCNSKKLPKKTRAWKLAQLDLDAQFLGSLREAAARRYKKWPTRRNGEDLNRLDDKLFCLNRKIRKLDRKAARKPVTAD